MNKQNFMRDYIDCSIPVIKSRGPFVALWTDEIIDCVCVAFNVTASDLKCSSRIRPLAYPRFAAMALIKKYRSYSHVRIGKIFGGRDHTTVMYALDRVVALRAENKSFCVNFSAAEGDLLSRFQPVVWPPVITSE